MKKKAVRKNFYLTPENLESLEEIRKLLNMKSEAQALRAVIMLGHTMLVHLRRGCTISADNEIGTKLSMRSKGNNGEVERIVFY